MQLRKAGNDTGFNEIRNNAVDGQVRGLYKLLNETTLLAINGTTGPEVMTGGIEQDHFWGRGGNDTLDGGGGVDRLKGGMGNDIYVVEDARCRVIEWEEAGTDIVFSSVSFKLAANTEKLDLTGAGNLDGTGNALANFIGGTTGNNRLSGGWGRDTLDGGSGDDMLTGGLGK